MATDCTLPKLELQALRKVVGDFKGGRLSSEGGVLLLREADRAVGLTRRLAGCFSDCRNQERVEHPGVQT